MSCERARVVALLGLVGCYAQTSGITVAVEVGPCDGELALVQGRRTLTNDVGQAVTIERGWIAVTHAALERCSSGDQARTWLPALESTADAGELTSVGDDLDAGVVPLGVRGGDRTPLGVLRPTPGSFCGVTVQYGPVGSLEDTGVPDGTWTLDLDLGDGASRTLHDASRHLAVAKLDPPLQLDAGHMDAALTLALPVRAWFNGIRATDSDEALGGAINQNLAAPPRVELR